HVTMECITYRLPYSRTQCNRQCSLNGCPACDLSTPYCQRLDQVADSNDHIGTRDFSLILETLALGDPRQPEVQRPLAWDHHDARRAGRKGAGEVDPLDAVVPLRPPGDVLEDGEDGVGAGSRLDAVLVLPHSPHLHKECAHIICALIFCH